MGQEMGSETEAPGGRQARATEAKAKAKAKAKAGSSGTYTLAMVRTSVAWPVYLMSRESRGPRRWFNPATQPIPMAVAIHAQRREQRLCACAFGSRSWLMSNAIQHDAWNYRQIPGLNDKLQSGVAVETPHPSLITARAPLHRHTHTHTLKARPATVGDGARTGL